MNELSRERGVWCFILANCLQDHSQSKGKVQLGSVQFSSVQLYRTSLRLLTAGNIAPSAGVDNTGQGSTAAANADAVYVE